MADEKIVKGKEKDWIGADQGRLDLQEEKPMIQMIAVTDRPRMLQITEAGKNQNNRVPRKSREDSPYDYNP